MADKTFTIEYAGLTLVVEATDNGNGTTSISIKCVEGYADLNAFYWNDGVDDGTSFALTGKNTSSLNMNGTGEDWDGGLKLSDTGLGKEGTTKATYLTLNETYPSFNINIGIDNLDTIGIRATSTSTAEGSIKGVAGVDEETNAPPVANNDSYEVDEDAALNVASAAAGILGNDSDPDGEDIDVASVKVGADTITDGGLGDEDGVAGTITFTTAAGGTVVLNTEDGTFSYDQNGEFDGLDDGEEGQDSFQYIATDGDASSGLATVNITINGVNDAPSGMVFVPTTDGSSFTPGYFHASDPEGDTIAYSIVSSTASATAITVNGATGVLNIDGGLAGSTHTITVRATDGEDSTDTTFQLVLGNNSDNTIPGGVFVVAADNNIVIGRNGVDNVTGSAGTDFILGGNGGETINGGDGDDVIVGGAGSGNDQLTGGNGNDVFKYIATGDSSGPNFDTITDWANGDNTIDVSMIDANPDVSAPGDQAFIYGGSTATNNGVWFTEAGGNTTVHFDTSGNAATGDEMTIVLTGINLGLTANDFVL
ncbi:MAG TPA: Ig-like domain-containing protein [Roseimicrobium sp.]|nr:Ig-like domain-containing protein [Roseimicrobium sp.]